MKREWKDDVLAIMGYALLTAVLTYPLVFRLNDIAGGDSDAFAFIWVFWWVKKAILELHASPYFSDYIFYPDGVSLAFHPLTLANSLPAVILQFFFTPVEAYNLIVLFTFVASGYGVYLLASYLTKDRLASFVAGLIFAFSPFRFARALGHLTPLSTEWIPFYILYLLKTRRENSLKNSLAAGFFLALVALTDGYLMMFVFIFTVLYLAFEIYTARKDVLYSGFTRRFVIALFLFALIALPAVYPMIKTATSKTYMVKSIDSAVIVSADLLAFITPSRFHPIFGRFVEGIYSRFTSNLIEKTQFVGYSVLFLALYAISKVKTKERRFWSISALVFFVLSLGPALHVFGRFMFPSPIPLVSLAKAVGIQTSELGQELLNRYFGIPLPYLLLYLYLPFFSISRSPARFGVMVILSLAILAGYGLSALSQRMGEGNWRGFKKRSVVAAAFSIIVVFEFMAVPFPAIPSKVPEFYAQLSRDDANYGILEVPIEPRGELMYYATVHGKKIMWGHIARIPPEATAFIEKNSLLNWFKCVGTIRPSIQQGMLGAVVSSNPNTASIVEKYVSGVASPDEVCGKFKFADSDAALLKEKEIKYIVVYKGGLSAATLEEVERSFRNMLPYQEPIYDAEEMVVYRVY